MPLSFANLVMGARHRRHVSTPDIRTQSGPNGETYAQLPPLARIFATPRWQLPASIKSVRHKRKPSPKQLFNKVFRPSKLAKQAQITEADVLRETEVALSIIEETNAINNTATAESVAPRPLTTIHTPNAVAADDVRWVSTPVEAANHPFTVYTRADDELRALTDRFVNSNAETVRNLAPRAHILHQQQLRALHVLVRMMVPRSRFGPQAYRSRIPQDDRNELERDGYCESVLFAARALARGYRIRGAERDTFELRDLGVALYAAYEAVRVRLRCELARITPSSVDTLLMRYAFLDALRHASRPTQNLEADEWTHSTDDEDIELYTVLQCDTAFTCRSARKRAEQDANISALMGIRAALMDFHRSWVAFERAVCRCYFCTEGHRPGCRHQGEISCKVVQQWRDTLTIAVHEQLLDANMVAEVDPSVVLAVPRLALLDTALRDMGALCTRPVTLAPVSKARSCPNLISAAAAAAGRPTSGNTAESASQMQQHDMSPEGHGLMQTDPDNEPDVWWTGYSGGLVALRAELRTFSTKDLRQLRRRLVLSTMAAENASELPVLAKSAKVDAAFRSICAHADALHSGAGAQRCLALLGRVLDGFSNELESRLAHIQANGNGALRLAGRNASANHEHHHHQHEHHQHAEDDFHDSASIISSDDLQRSSDSFAGDDEELRDPSRRGRMSRGHDAHHVNMMMTSTKVPMTPTRRTAALMR
ncbi:hypothetical protein SYNPS1DRAFT_23661 [Syncephalis pseudoplumigaleata]|uniref:Uncharacterized protein n=1 Tax=Syncephalis pseudoplumigaleata TaxID=1712513 RepID=A0A4P9YW15_9FUNG|nr:hypothetical protein SYNPS1DRAFT_23661 [Syncephalis pseudoplumigaleata]|eukprot:RKP24246.1 hypothetical protein SYNPS1DRAFT_23661 [Syncephalis pseudoplumigaleata]